MAYDKKELEKKALDAIKKHNLMFIENIIAYLPCGKTTFYELKLNESNSIKKAIEQTRISRKVAMQNNWFKSETPSLQIALMKMIADDHEAHRLNGTKQEIKQTGNIESRVVEWIPANKDEDTA
tara:strand:- start:61 stop:432 length:372 start_codon:yes stop_codon:yes gene_type:complete